MPALVRNGGKLWGADGGEDDTLAVIPDSSYASIYQATIDDVIANGPLDPATIGSVSNVGLMAQAAEEYGSHDKTFEIAAPGVVQVVDGDGQVVIEHDVQQGDIWRATQTKYIPSSTGCASRSAAPAPPVHPPCSGWTSTARTTPQVIAKVYQALATMDTERHPDLDPRARRGHPLQPRAHAPRPRHDLGHRQRAARLLTDLFPILEVGTSAKMLSIVPLLAGGGLFETGAGGSAPKHVQQLVEENYLRWDSLGEFFALAASLEHLATFTGNVKAQVLADTLDAATGTFLENDKSPGPRARHDRQPRQPLLPRALLGAGARRPEGRPRTRRRLRAGGGDARREGAGRSSPSCSPSRARRSRSAGTTTPTRSSSRRSCVPRRPSTTIVDGI